MRRWMRGLAFGSGLVIVGCGGGEPDTPIEDDGEADAVQVAMSIEFLDGRSGEPIPSAQATWIVVEPLISDFATQPSWIPVGGSALDVSLSTPERFEMDITATAPGYDTVEVTIVRDRSNSVLPQTIYLTPLNETTTVVDNTSPAEPPPPPPPMGRVAFETDPPGATVVLRDQNGRDRTYTAPFNRSLPPGRYEWTATLDGHETARSNGPVDVRVDETTRLSPSLAEIQELGSVNFSTSPAGATVTLTGEGQRYEFTTPFSEQLPPGLYEWTVDLPGYAPESGDNALNVRAGASESVNRTLREANFSALKEQGDACFEAQDFDCAVQSYRALGVEPPQGGGSLALEFADAQIRLGQAYLGQDESAGAEEAFRLALNANPREYRAPYYLGVVACINEDYTEGRRQLDRVASEFGGDIPAADKPGMEALASYQSGVCTYQEHVNGRPEMRTRAISSLLSFRRRAEELVADNTGSPTLLDVVRVALDDAVGKLQELGVNAPHPIPNPES